MPHTGTRLGTLVGFYSYADPLLRSAIKRYKYHGARGIEPLLTGLLGSQVALARHLFAQAGTVVPLPLHPARLRERGFNQAERLAYAVAGALEAPIAYPLIRVRRTDPQADLRHDERVGNIARAFRASPVHGDIVLVDDVVTTGATMEAAAAALKSAGARSVTGVALAHG